MNIEKIIIGKRHRAELGDLDILARSIAELGLLQPIIIRKGTGELIAGYRRLCALKKMGVTDLKEGMHVRFIDIESIVRGEHDENICRKDFTISEKVAIFEAVKEEQLRVSMTRQILSGRERQGYLPGVVRDKKQMKEKTKIYGVARYQAAQVVGLHQNTLRKATEIIHAAKKEPKKYGYLVKEMDASGKIDPIFQRYVQEKLKFEHTSGYSPELARLVSDPEIRIPDFLANAMVRLTCEHQDELVRIYRDFIPDVKRGDFERFVRHISKGGTIGEIPEPNLYEAVQQSLEYTRICSQEWMFLPQVRQVASLIMHVAKTNHPASTLDKLDFFMIGLAGFVDMSCNYLKVAKMEGILECVPADTLEKYLAAIDAFQMLYESKLPRQVGALRLKEEQAERREGTFRTIRDVANAMKANEMITDAAEGNITYYKSQIESLIRSFREGAETLKP